MPAEMVAIDDNDNTNNNNNNSFFPELSDQAWILDKPISVLTLDAADRKVLKVADQRDAVQKKTFTKWMNYYLSARNGLHVEDLFVDLRDGHVLLTLLEIFTNQTIVRRSKLCLPSQRMLCIVLAERTWHVEVPRAEKHRAMPAIPRHRS